MSAFGGIRRVLRLGVAQRELEEELAFHFERTTEELVERGMPRGEAEAEARRRFGDERRWRRELERIDRGLAARLRWRERWETASGSVALAGRRIRRSPGFALGVVLTFGLGIGANATMFGVVDRVLLSPPAHVAEAGEVKRLMVERFYDFMGSREVEEYLTYPDYLDFTRARSLSGVAAYATRDLTLGRGEAARQVRGQLVTGSYFPVLGVRPALGRLFGPEDDRAGGQPVAVISHGAWRREYGGDPDVLGRTIDFGSGPYPIVGVAPEGFSGVDLEQVDVWLPVVATRLHESPETRVFESRNSYWLRVVGRLAPGATGAQVDAELTTLHRQGRQESIAADRYDPRAAVLATPLITARGPRAPEEAAVAKWLVGISLIVLLIACANVANLLLARSVRQRREVGIRLALGSSRARVLGQVLTESLLLALLGGVAALLVTHWGGGVLRRVLLPEVAWGQGGMELRVAGVILLLAVLAGVASGMIPALQGSRPDLTESLKSASRSTAGGASRLRDGLTVVQAALSVVLLVGAGLFVRSLQEVRSLDLGIDPRGVVLFTPVFDRGLAREQRAQVIRRASERLDHLPGVVAASPDETVPFYTMSAIPLRAPDLDSIPRLSTGGAALHVVEHDFFETVGLEMRRGREIQPGDVRGTEPVVVINETMARTLWPGQEALGKCLVIGGGEGEPEPPCSRVVGVVEDSRRFDLREDPSMNYYVPLPQWPEEETPEYILIRVQGDAASMIPTLQREMLAIDPALRYAEMQPLQERIDPQARSWTLGAAVISAFGLLALVVAGIGLYSVLAFGVAQRTLELGIRAALGATRERIARLVLGQALRLVGVGAVLGLGVAVAAGPKLEPLLFQVSPRDPAVLGGVVAALLVVGALAGLLPARRATRVDPSEALRAD